MANAWNNAHGDIRVAAGAHRRSDSLARAHGNRLIGAALNDECGAAYAASVRDGIDCEETALVRREGGGDRKLGYSNKPHCFTVLQPPSRNNRYK